YAMQSADFFAKYAMESLNLFNIDMLCFGSESNDIDYLRSISSNDIDPSTSYQRNNMHLNPNDILANQYIKYCDQYNIEPISIPRNTAFKSATQTRKDAYIEKQDFDEYFHIEENWNNLYPYLKMTLLMTRPEQLSSFFLVNEGIEYRLIKYAKQCDNFNDFLQSCISKTYSKARIQRTCLMILLQITKEDMIVNNHFNMVKVLGFDSIGQKLLKENKDKCIYTKYHELPEFLQDIDRKSRDLYASIYDGDLEDRKVVIYDR
ncbi:MAG: nucleotidyltransferase family protein, partial [Holdemanella sp.]|nr:nucleotidyltransferase family protein [Holdemanella sp.]